MADQSKKTEKPTQKRLQKAREDGRFPSSRDFVGGLQFIACLMMLGAWGPEWFSNLQQAARLLITRAFTPELSAASLVNLGWMAAQQIVWPVAGAGAVLVLLTLGFQFALTRFGFSLKRLAPNWNRLNPASRLKDLPKQNAFATFQTVLTLILSSAALYWIAKSHTEELLLLPLTPLDSAMSQAFHALLDLMWKAGGVYAAFGCVDLYRQKKRFNDEMMMTRQEIRDEFREAEGNPEIKARVRRLQRAAARRKMLRQVPQATAVIVNPTHYAVAIRYEVSSATAPTVVAKGKNHLALRIKRLATVHGVPIVENQPLARALYQAVPLNAEIPPHFYRAVAEVLAYVLRALNQSAPVRR